MKGMPIVVVGLIGSMAVACGGLPGDEESSRVAELQQASTSSSTSGGPAGGATGGGTPAADRVCTGCLASGGHNPDGSLSGQQTCCFNVPIVDATGHTHYVPTCYVEACIIIELNLVGRAVEKTPLQTLQTAPHP